MSVMTPEIKAAQDQLNSAIFKHIDYLYARWQDEKRYEDFKDYIDAVRRATPPGFVLQSMTKRPFAAKFHHQATNSIFMIRVSGRFIDTFLV